MSIDKDNKMSVEATIWAWSLSKQQVSSLEKLVLLSLADRANEKMECFPSAKRLTNDCNTNIKTIYIALDSLCKKNVIKKTGEMKGRTKSVPVYKLLNVQKREYKSTPENGSSKNEAHPKTGEVAHPKTGELSTPENGSLNLKEEPKNITSHISIPKPLSCEKFEDDNLPSICENSPPEKKEMEEMAEYVVGPFDAHQKSIQTIAEQLDNKDLTLKETYNLSDSQLSTFEMFWEIYPKKKDKRRAKAQWFASGCHLKAGEILCKLADQVTKDKAFLDGFSPGPTNYIIGHRWEDEIEEKKVNGHFNYKSKDWALKPKAEDDIFAYFQ